ncbi:acetolactate synthase catalytic subunit [Rhodococcus opacus]|uniref:acetolactate synthase catalytic subunit n=1 Tax=Rhodococcus opacus TaxID=37919 RepID=UPI00046D5822|nr:acetolactate synthase catalytic subunit [Rhodococcus opacus]UDH01500.1 acetolactate synthase catalytic subunit [Rhodococcus opacus PD630]
MSEQSPRPPLTVAEAVAAALQRHGVTVIFGQSLPSALMLAAPKFGIRQLAYRTENAAGTMADGYARISNTISVVAAQNGPAATLLVPPLAEATKASVPVLALVQDVPRGNRDRNAFQEFDHTDLFRSCSKWLRVLDDPARVDDYVDMAITAATSGRPGPAVLMLPRDVLLETAIDAGRRRAVLGRFPLDPVRPAADRIEEAADAIAAAERPLVVAGGGVHLSGAADILAQLQERAILPVATTNMGKGSVDERHPLSVGVVGNYMGPTGATHHLRSMVTDADVLVLVGTRTNENGTDAWSLISEDTRIVHIDVDSNEVGRNYEAIRVVGDARLALTDLLVALENRDLGKRQAGEESVRRQIAQARNDHANAVSELVTPAAGLVRPELVAHEIDKLLDDGETIVTADASYSSIWMGNYLRARRPGQRFLSPRGLAGLGWGMPLALGAKAARPDATVLCLTGDGGFGHVWSEFETAVRENLPIVVVLLNNGILGFQKHVELVQFGEYTDAVHFAAVDHAAIAKACGADGIRVTDALEVGDALAKAVASGRPTLVEIICDPHAYPPITGWSGVSDDVMSQ